MCYYPARFATSNTIEFFLFLSNQFTQKTCNIQFIETFSLKYGIYKPREVKNYIKKLVLAQSFLYQIFTSLGLLIQYFK